MVPRHLPGLMLWLALTAPVHDAISATPAPASAPALAPISISFAEQPVRLVRDTAIYSAGRGVALRANDMLESGSGAVQLATGGGTVALGPASRIFINGTGELVLLDGWLKLQGGAQRPLT